ncbi:MAG: hypothetical protein ACPGUV_00090 [Polyangiales bacterium]
MSAVEIALVSLRWLVLIFVPLERAFPAMARQRIVRAGFCADLSLLGDDTPHPRDYLGLLCYPLRRRRDTAHRPGVTVILPMTARLRALAAATRGGQTGLPGASRTREECGNGCIPPRTAAFMQRGERCPPGDAHPARLHCRGR